MLFCCLRRNVEASCHKHSVVVYRHQQTPPLATSDELATVRRRRVDNVYSTPPLGEYPSPQRLLWKNYSGVWLTDGEKKLKIYLLVSTEYTNVTDGRTERHCARA